MEEGAKVDEESKTPRERAKDLVSLLVSDWRPTTQQVLWAVRIAVVLVLLVAVGYYYGITLWDWLKLLVVPAAIAAGGLWFNRQQQARVQEIESWRAQDEALQAYLDQMGQLLLDNDRPLRQSKEGDEVSILARARTLSALSQLDGKRKGVLIRFLSEARLIQGTRGMESEVRSWTQHRPIIGLTAADLSNADLSDVDLTQALLAEASLRSASLRGADLSDTVLFDTDLTSADLLHATVTWWGGLNHCKSLKGATMPNGQKYEDWLKSHEKDYE